jgi:hypothetical protein
LLRLLSELPDDPLRLIAALHELLEVSPDQSAVLLGADDDQKDKQRYIPV